MPQPRAPDGVGSRPSARPRPARAPGPATSPRQTHAAVGCAKGPGGPSSQNGAGKFRGSSAESLSDEGQVIGQALLRMNRSRGD